MVLEQYTESDSDYFAENYIDNNSAHITENISYVFNQGIISENALISDITSVQVPQNTVDQIQSSDSFNTEITYNRTFTENTTIQDVVTKYISFERNFSDSITVVDSADVLKYLGQIDSTVTTDTLQYTLNKGTISDFVSKSDANSKLVEKYISVVDEYSSQQYFAQNYVDSNSATITDSSSLSVQPLLADTINSSSDTSFNVGKPLSDNIEAHDEIGRAHV